MDSLLEHLNTEHEALCRGSKSVVAAYCLALSYKCRREAPLAPVSLDRRALRNYRVAMGSADMAELICLICARRYSRNRTVEQNPARWRRILREDKVLNCTKAEAEIIFGKAQYCEKMLQELDAWSLKVRLSGQALELLCCPEDKGCVQNCPPNVCCSWCRAPVCATCFSAISQKKSRPVEALSNDMMVFYALREMYEHEATLDGAAVCEPMFNEYGLL